MKRHLMRMLIGTSVLVGGLISDVGVGAAQAQHFGGHRGGHGGYRGGHGRHRGGHGRHWGDHDGYRGGFGGRGGYWGDDDRGQFISPDFDSDEY
jgi:hypothetical protein